MGRLNETALDDDLRWAADAVTSPPETEPGRSLADRWPSADSAWSYGESPRKALIRERVLDYLDVHGRDVSLPSLLAHLNIDPSYKEFVGEILNGTEQPEFESVDRRRREPQFGYELKAIVDADGNEHQPGGGGVDMVSLESPIKNIIQNTRLGNDLSEGEIYRDARTEVASHNQKMIAARFVEDGITDPRVVERFLIVEDYQVSNPSSGRDERRRCMVHPSER